MKTNPSRPKIIFFGNGPLANFAFPILYQNCDILFHAKTKADLESVKELKTTHPDAHGILASFGVIIKQDLLALFEPEGILNIHPSLLPKYRGPSPIESAILNGDSNFGLSIMKLVAAMDAGPIYHQTSLSLAEIVGPLSQKLTPNSSTSPLATDTKFLLPPLEQKNLIYQKLAETGATWLTQNLLDLPTPQPQDDSKATYTQKFDTSMSLLDPSKKSATKLLQEIYAFAKFPKSKYTFFGLECTIINAHLAAPSEKVNLSLQCYDGSILAIDQLQPANRKIMDAKSFINGYANR